MSKITHVVLDNVGEAKKKKKGDGKGKGKGKRKEESVFSRSSSISIDDEGSDDGALHLTSVSNATGADGVIAKPPSLLADGVQLKDYQLIGVSWLHLLHSKGLSCILADEMGK